MSLDQSHPVGIALQDLGENRLGADAVGTLIVAERHDRDRCIGGAADETPLGGRLGRRKGFLPLRNVRIL